MDIAHHRSSWRLVLVPVVAAALLFGWIFYANRGASPRRVGAPPAPLSVADAMLAATKATGGTFLQYDTVTGPPSTDHSDHAALISVQFGVSRSVGAGAAGAERTAGPAANTDLCVTKNTDKYSVGFFSESVQGHAHDAIIYFVTAKTTKGVPFEYLRYEMTDAIISSWKPSSNGDRPAESMCFNFTKLKIQYQQSGLPAQQSSWDFVSQVTLPVGGP